MTFSIFLCQVLALLVLSGPLVPMLAVLHLSRASKPRLRRQAWTLLLLASLQGMASVPYLLASREVEDQGEALMYTAFPFLCGLLLFISTLVYALAVCAQRRVVPNPPPA